MRRTRAPATRPAISQARTATAGNSFPFPSPEIQAGVPPSGRDKPNKSDARRRLVPSGRELVRAETPHVQQVRGGLRVLPAEIPRVVDGQHRQARPLSAYASQAPTPRCLAGAAGELAAQPEPRVEIDGFTHDARRRTRGFGERNRTREHFLRTPGAGMSGMIGWARLPRGATTVAFWTATARRASG